MRATVLALLVAVGAATDTVLEAGTMSIESSAESVLETKATENLESMGMLGKGSLETQTIIRNKDVTYVGDHGDFGRTLTLPTTPSEKCAIYQEQLKIQNVADTTLIGQQFGGELGAGGKQSFKTSNEDVSTQEKPWSGYPDLDGAARTNTEPFCYAACGIREVCPDNCKTTQDIADYCDALDGTVHFDPDCGFCSDVCRSSCISFVSNCCGCAAAKVELDIDPDEYYIQASVIPYILECKSCSDYIGGDTDEDLDGETTQESHVYVALAHNGTGSSDVKLFIEANDKKERKKGNNNGFGLVFSDVISKTKFTKATALFVWPNYEFFSAKDYCEEGFGIEGTFRWRHDEDEDKTEDQVFASAVNEDSGYVYYKMPARLRLVFKDSTGWHISEQYFEMTGTRLAPNFIDIKAAAPSMNYFTLYPQLQDAKKAQAGIIGGPSKPSFNCIEYVGFHIEAVAKLMFTKVGNRDLESAEGVVEGQQTVEEQDAEVDSSGLFWKKPKDQYVAYVENFVLEAKYRTVGYRTQTVL